MLQLLLGRELLGRDLRRESLRQLAVEAHVLGWAIAAQVDFLEGRVWGWVIARPVSALVISEVDVLAKVNDVVADFSLAAVLDLNFFEVEDGRDYHFSEELCGLRHRANLACVEHLVAEDHVEVVVHGCRHVAEAYGASHDCHLCENGCDSLRAGHSDFFRDPLHLPSQLAERLHQQR